jgi:hypothetical protein
MLRLLLWLEEQRLDVTPGVMHPPGGAHRWEATWVDDRAGSYEDLGRAAPGMAPDAGRAS